MKKLFALILSAVAVFALFSVAACDNGKEDSSSTEVKYSFTVCLPDGSPAEGVTVIACEVETDANGNKTELNCLPCATTGADGKAEFVPQDPTIEYHIKVSFYGYTCADEYYTEGKSATFTFNLIED